MPRGLVLGAIVVVAVGLRLVGLDRKSVWFDEAITYFDAYAPWGQLLESLRHDVHPPLSYVLYHLWPGIDGGDFWLRLPSALFGAAAVLPAWAWARRIGSPVQALLTSGFIALSALQIDLAQEARMYALLLLLTATSLWLLDRVMTCPGRNAVLAYGVVAIAMLYTHYYAGLLLAAQALAVLLGPGRRKWALAALGLAAVSFAPWLPVLAQQAGSIRGDYWIEAPRLTTLWVTFRELAAHTPPEQLPRVLYVVQAALVLLGATLALSTPRQRVAVMLGVLPLGLAVAVSLLVAPVYAVRYISPLGLAFGFLLARGITSLPKAGAIVAAALASLPVALSLGPLYTDPGYARSDLRAAAYAVQAARRPEEVVLHLGAFTAAPFDYYRVAQPGRVLETNGREELCAAMRPHGSAWLVTAYLAADEEARTAAEAGITSPGYAGDLARSVPMRFLGVSVFHVGGC